MFFSKKNGGNFADLSDEDVVKNILDGQDQFREVLYDRYSNKILFKCISITKDRETSKDLTHDIIVKIFLNLSKYQGKSDFSYWVNSITYHYCMDYFSKQKRMSFDTYDNGDIENIPFDNEELNLKVQKDNQLVKVEKSLELLNSDDKIIIMMCYQDSMSIRDIAEALQIGESAVKMRLARARKRIHKIIEGM